MKTPEALFPDPEASSTAGISICWAEIHLSFMNASPNRPRKKSESLISKCEAKKHPGRASYLSRSHKHLPRQQIS